MTTPLSEALALKQRMQPLGEMLRSPADQHLSEALALKQRMQQKWVSTRIATIYALRGTCAETEDATRKVWVHWVRWVPLRGTCTETEDATIR